MVLGAWFVVRRRLRSRHAAHQGPRTKNGLRTKDGPGTKNPGPRTISGLPCLSLVVVFDGKHRAELQELAERAVPERRAETEQQAGDQYAEHVDLTPALHPFAGRTRRRDEPVLGQE